MRVVVTGWLALGVVGCKGNCRQLSEKSCECAINSYERDACMRTASASESNVQITAADDAYCGTLLSRCDCRLVDTAQGKVNCGLAWPQEQPVAN